MVEKPQEREGGPRCIEGQDGSGIGRKGTAQGSGREREELKRNRERETWWEECKGSTEGKDPSE